MIIEDLLAQKNARNNFPLFLGNVMHVRRSEEKEIEGNTIQIYDVYLSSLSRVVNAISAIPFKVFAVGEPVICTLISGNYYIIGAPPPDLTSDYGSPSLLEPGEIYLETSNGNAFLLLENSGGVVIRGSVPSSFETIELAIGGVAEEGEHIFSIRRGSGLDLFSMISGKAEFSVNSLNASISSFTLSADEVYEVVNKSTEEVASKSVYFNTYELTGNSIESDQQTTPSEFVFTVNNSKFTLDNLEGMVKESATITAQGNFTITLDSGKVLTVDSGQAKLELQDGSIEIAVGLEKIVIDSSGITLGKAGIGEVVREPGFSLIINSIVAKLDAVCSIFGIPPLAPQISAMLQNAKSQTVKVD
ncbi:MAG: hypothetical protein QXY76_03325 [Nitrososphaeria archaeon]